MLSGKLAKAERGELVTPLPIGYVRRPSGEAAFDPDEQALLSGCNPRYTGILALRQLTAGLGSGSLDNRCRAHSGMVRFRGPTLAASRAEFAPERHHDLMLEMPSPWSSACSAGLSADSRLRDDMSMNALPVRKQVVEEALGNSVAEGLQGAELGKAIIDALDDFLFRDIEDERQALELFAFIDDDSARGVLASCFRGARWHQKVGLVLARPSAHPAHAAQVRTQLIEYGAICETALRRMLEQNGGKKVPEDFKDVIEKCKSAGILKKDGKGAADLLRDGRNKVHLFLQPERQLQAEREARGTYAALTRVLNECREFRKLPEWKFGQDSAAQDAVSLPSE